MPNPPRQVTIAQVAEYAGVSQASVSRVLNRNQTVDPAISAKVSEAIEKLNYSPSQMARNLVRGRSNTVALVVPDLENPMFQGVLKGLSREAALDGYRVLVADTAERVADEEEIAVEARSRCDALVLVSPRMPAERLEALLARSGPIVVVNRPVASDPAAELSVDYEHAVRTLGEHLVSLGHSRIAYLSGPPQAYADGLRRRGLAELVARHAGVDVLDIAGGSQVEDGYRAAEDVLSSSATAVIAFNDLVALGLLARLRDLAVDVPGEFSVTGIDDIPLARFAAPAIASRSRRHDWAPSSTRGTDMVVSAGAANRARGMSSMPVTEISPGTSTASSRRRASSPSATRSLKAMTAVALDDSTSSAARYPSSTCDPPAMSTTSTPACRATSSASPRRRSPSA